MKKHDISPLPLGEVAELGVDVFNALVKRVRATIHLHKALTRNRYALSTSPNGRGNTAFTLVELSIVLVILGLLVGGVLAGQNLIRAAELRSLSTETENYKAAVWAFREKYLAFPGDMTNATAFWGEMTNCGAASPSSTGTQTCNGDGDGEIDNPSGQGRTGETFQFWQHLALAGMLEGTYTGIAGPTESNGYHYIPGENVPQPKLSRANLWVLHRDLVSLNTTSKNFTLDYGNHFLFGTKASNGNVSDTDLLKPEELWAIDKKFDDSLPAAGNIIASRWTDGCVSFNSGSAATNNYDASYDLSLNEKACGFFYLNIF